MVSIILLLLRGPSPQSESPFPDPESTTAHSLPPFTLAGHHSYLPPPPPPPPPPIPTPLSALYIMHRSASVLRCCCRRRGRVCEQRSVGAICCYAATHPFLPTALNFRRMDRTAVDQFHQYVRQSMLAKYLNARKLSFRCFDGIFAAKTIAYASAGSLARSQKHNPISMNQERFFGQSLPKYDSDGPWFPFLLVVFAHFEQR